MKNIEKYTYLNDENLLKSLNYEYMKVGVCCDSVTNNTLVFVSARFRRIAKINTEILEIIRIIEKTTNGMEKQNLLDYIRQDKIKNCCKCQLNEKVNRNLSVFYPYLLIRVLELEEEIIVEYDNLSMFENAYDIEKEKNILLLIQSEIIKYMADKYIL